MALLEVKDVTRRFGGIIALDEVSFDVEAGQIVGLIGPNGAGKTTTFNVITRLYRPDSGELRFAGESLLSTPPHRVIQRGIARTFQNLELFKTMSARENVVVGTHARVGGRSVDEIIDYVGIGDVADRASGIAAVRDAEARRDRARSRLRAETPAARRAGRWAVPRGGRAARCRSCERCDTTSTSRSCSSSTT